jgi:hypothetical protein
VSPAQRPRAGSNDLPAQLRAGNVVRVNIARRVECVCLDCPADFGNTGAAASHARSARHVVEVDYAVRFAFEPRERSGGAR